MNIFGIKSRKTKLPESFRPILWSYNFSSIDLDKNAKTVIINAINYGNLNHWKWIAGYYGKERIKKILTSIPASEIKPRTRRLAGLVFSIKNFNYVSRGANR